MSIRAIHGDCREVLKTLPDESVHCVVCSPPYYGLRDYGIAGQIGLEATPDAYVAELVAVFREVRRVLRNDGTLWCNLGDSYAANRSYQVSQSKHQAHDYGGSNATRVPLGLKPKDLLGIPWMVAFALRADGWWLRSDVIWSKPNPMPESVTDRPTSAHEHVFLFAKSSRYYFDAEAVKEPDVAGHKSGNGYVRVDTKNIGIRLSYGGRGQQEQWEPGGGRNIRNVWTVATQPFSEAHFATFPPALIEPCIKAGCPRGGVVLDPFAGAGTTGLVADRLGRDAILIELNEDYSGISRRRIQDDAPLFAEVTA